MRKLAYILLVSCASLRVNESTDKYSDIKLEAHEAWKGAGVETTTAYSLEYLSAAAIVERCGQHGIDGCTHLSRSEIFLKDGLSYQRQLMVLIHEVGHLTEGSPTHLKCTDSPGENVMCSSAARDGSRPTKKDVEFITGKIEQ